MTKISIIINQVKNYYIPGDSISGNVIVEIKKSIKFNTFYINLKGKSHTFWKTGTGEDTKCHSSNHYFFDEKTVILASSTEPIFLGAGSHKYGFNFVLPKSDFPSSFECKFGWIRYYLKVKIIKKLSKIEEGSTPFYVINPHNINLPNLMTFKEISNNKNIKCCCCSCFCFCCFYSSPILLRLRCNKTGFRPGEFIYFSCSCLNTTSSPLTPTIKIISETFFHADDGEEKCITKTVNKLEGEIVEKGEEMKWEHFLQLPQVVYSINCPNIKFNYFLVLKIKRNVLSKIETKIPLVVGEPISHYPNPPSYCYDFEKKTPPIFITPSSHPSPPPPPPPILVTPSFHPCLCPPFPRLLSPRPPSLRLPSPRPPPPPILDIPSTFHLSPRPPPTPPPILDIPSSSHLSPRPPPPSLSSPPPPPPPLSSTSSSPVPSIPKKE